MSPNDQQLHGAANPRGGPATAGKTDPRTPPNQAQASQAGGAVEAQNAETQAAEDVDSLQAKAAELQDRLLRTQAELENYRKRSKRELEDQRRYAEIELIRDILPVADAIDRIISAAKKQADVGILLDATKMLRQQLKEVFEKHHAKVITAAGEPFDPNRHEAVMQQPSEEHPEHTVLVVAQQGMTLHDRVVRPAQVIVSKKPGS
jgi:molecular chaperone GrpE